MCVSLSLFSLSLVCVCVCVCVQLKERNDDAVVVIGIAGPTGAGKSNLAQKVAEFCFVCLF